MVRVALGDQEGAYTWFTVALSYDASVQIPAGTSPKIRTLFDELAARLTFARPIGGTPTPTPTPKLTNAPKTPGFDALGDEKSAPAVRGQGSMFWTYAAGGATVVAAGLAVTFGVMTYSTASDIESRPHERAELEDLQDKLDRQGDLANTFLATTGVLAATTAIVYLVRGRTKKSMESPAISVSAAADGAVVGTWSRFLVLKRCRVRSCARLWSDSS